MKVLNQVEFNPANQFNGVTMSSSREAELIERNMFNNLNYYMFFH